MKKTIFFTYSLLLVIYLLTLPLRFAIAENSPQWALPEGVKARLGKGGLREIRYSHDSIRLAVASTVGIWVYDTATHEEIALLGAHTNFDSVGFSPADARSPRAGKTPPSDYGTPSQENTAIRRMLIVK